MNACNTYLIHSLTYLVHHHLMPLCLAINTRLAKDQGERKTSSHAKTKSMNACKRPSNTQDPTNNKESTKGNPKETQRKPCELTHSLTHPPTHSPTHLSSLPPFPSSPHSRIIIIHLHKRERHRHKHRRGNFADPQRLRAHVGPHRDA